MAIVEVGENKYHVDNKLMKMWQRRCSLKYLKDNNTDRWFVVSGYERVGKTTWTVGQMGAIEPEVFETPEKMVSRICFSPQEFKDTVSKVKNGVVIFDEAFRGLSSRSALSKVNRLIIQTMMEVGQNNNLVFLVLPSFFMLDIYPAMLRSSYLFHIKIDKKSKMRKFVGYNRKDKNKIYQIGLKRGWNYAFESKFKGRFSKKFPGGPKFEKAYLKKKAQALQTMEDESNKPTKQEETSRFVIQRDFFLGNLIELIKKRYKLTFKGIETIFKTKNLDFDWSNVSRVYQDCRKGGLIIDFEALTLLNNLLLTQRGKKEGEKDIKMIESINQPPINSQQGVQDVTGEEQGTEETKGV